MMTVVQNISFKIFQQRTTFEQKAEKKIIQIKMQKL